MRLEVIFKFLGFILLFNALFLLISFIISAFSGESSVIPLAYSMLICIIFGLFPMIFVGKVEYLSFNEGISIVVYGWLITCVIGSLPYLMWGGEFTLINSWFESVSGFTTTGSSILNDVEKLPKGLLFWRSSTHWIGGLGVIMFVLLILPTSQNPRLTLINTEMSDISRSTFQYRARKTAYVLAMIYAGLTVMETLLLTLAGMGLFDAINHSFATIATGGFSTRNLSIAAYNQLSIEVIIMLFMILSGINFGILFNTVSGKSPNIFNSRIVRAYLFILLAGIVVATTDLYLEGVYSFSQSLRAAAFQVISLGTTTGFATQATEVWPSFTQLILIFFTIQCAMVGSTSGGLKFDRIFIFFKSIVKQVKMMKHPNAVITIKVDNISLDDQRESNVMNFIVLYVITFFITTLILSVFNTDLITAFSASIATLGNVGPGFGQVSSLGNYADLPVFSKLVLTFNMLLGRLEILSIIAFLTIRRKEF